MTRWQIASGICSWAFHRYTTRQVLRIALDVLCRILTETGITCGHDDRIKLRSSLLVYEQNNIGRYDEKERKKGERETINNYSLLGLMSYSGAPLSVKVWFLLILLVWIYIYISIILKLFLYYGAYRQRCIIDQQIRKPTPIIFVQARDAVHSLGNKVELFQIG